MGTKAYFMISLEKAIAEDGHYAEAIRELETIPEVQAVEAVSGTYDLVAEVEAPIRVILVAHKVLEKEWVRRLHILRVEPAEHEAVIQPEPKAQPTKRETTAKLIAS